MITSLKQKKINFKPMTKLNHNINIVKQDLTTVNVRYQNEQVC